MTRRLCLDVSRSTSGRTFGHVTLPASWHWSTPGTGTTTRHRQYDLTSSCRLAVDAHHPSPQSTRSTEGSA
eukprot:3486217-Rhodomonas_salina.1